jgi:hypothetical protein
MFLSGIRTIVFPKITVKHDISGEIIPIPGLVLIGSPPDGSCLFHSILRGFNKEYNISTLERRVEMARNMRNLLADAINQTVHDTNVTYYELMARGNLSSLGKTYSDYSLENLQKLLRSTQSVGIEFIEALGHFLSLDIYIIDMKTKDLYFMGSDMSLYHKGRRSIILGYTQISDKRFDDGHYETIGLNVKNEIFTLFDPENFVVKSLNMRYEHLRDQKIRLS